MINDYSFSGSVYPSSVGYDSVLIHRYDEAADSWGDVIKRLGYDAAYKTLFHDLQQSGRLTSLKPDSKVLDVGIGSGALSLGLVGTVTFPMALYGVDISSKMLVTSQRNLARLGVKGRLRRSSADQLPYEDNSFDMVMTAHVLEHLDDPLNGLAEMMRVLKPGGQLLTLMTKQGLWGQWIRQKWGIRPISERQLLGKFDDAGVVDGQMIGFGRNSWIQWATVAGLGKKPSHELT